MRDTQWRGYLRTATGNPITVDNALSVSKLTVQGNSVQNGTPSVDNPVEVVGVGERILPAEYTQLDYIEGTGTQWINTDFRPNQNSGIYLKAQLTEIEKNAPDDSGRMFAGSVNSNFGIGYNASNGLYRFIFTRKQGVGSDANNIPFPDTLDINIHEFKNNFLDDSKFWVDGMTREAPEWVFQNDYGIAIFRTTYENANNYYNAPIKAKIYSFKFSQGNEVVADLIPAQRISDDKVGMYDIINNTFYSSAGTEEFLAGNSIEIYKIPVEVTGKNLFDEEDFIKQTGAAKDENGYITLPDNRALQYNIEVKENIRYTLSIICDTDTQFQGLQIQFLDANLGKINEIYLRTSVSPYSIQGENIKYISIRGAWTSKYTIVFKNLMIIEGEYTAETIPQYEPYIPPHTLNVFTPQILHGLGSVSDKVTIDFGNRRAELTKRYEYFKVNTPDWAAGSDSYDGEITTNRYHAYTEVYEGRFSVNDSKCNVLPKYNGGLWGTDEQGFTWNASQLHLRINNSVLGITLDDTREGRTAKFKEYIQNNDIYVLGKLVTPTTTDISDLQAWDNMPNLTGTLTLTASGTAEPTLRAEYYSYERSTE